MGDWGIFIFTTAAALFVFTNQSNGLDTDVSLCIELNIENTLVGGCENDTIILINMDNASGSDPSYKNDDPADPKRALRNGFILFNNTVRDAENIAMDGFSRANEMLTTEPKKAAEIMRKAIQVSTNILYTSGVPFFFHLGKALEVSSGQARPALVDASVEIQRAALKELHITSLATDLAIQGVRVGGNSAKQAIDTARKTIQSCFASMYYEVRNSYQKAYRVISDAQDMPTTMVKNQNHFTAAKDTEISAAILEINKAAEDSINTGAEPYKVNRLREALIGSLGDLAQIKSHMKDYFAYIQMLSDTDPVSAKTIYLENSKAANKRFQEICANICLDMAVAGIEFDTLSKKLIAQAFLAVEHGNVESSNANKIADKLILIALEESKGSSRSLLLSAGTQSAMYGIMDLDQKIVEAAKLAFKAL